MIRAIFISIVLGLLIRAASVDAEPSNRNLLRFGMSTALSGPAAQLGLNMSLGVRAAFSRANRNAEDSPSSAYKFDLTILDDGYEPERTVPNMRQLTSNQEILGIIGNVGTPTAIAAIPIALESKILFYAAYTGAGVLRKTPPDRYVINYRASYAEETSAMVNALIEHGGLSPNQIGFFTQRDGYGDAGYSGGIAALRQYGLKNESEITHARYERNTIAVENALADLLSAPTKLKAIIMVGSYAPCAAFIKLARSVGFNPLFLNVSFVGAEPLAQDLGKEVSGVIVTQVVPPYNQSTLPIIKEFKQDLVNIDSSAEPTFGALEGYIAGRILTLALSKTSVIKDREAVVNALENLGQFSLGLNRDLTISPNNHQASHAIWPTLLIDGHYQEFEWKEIKTYLH